MDYIDYTGKLNDHDKYLKILDLLEKKSKYIEIVVLDEKDSNELVDLFKKDIIHEDKVSEWFGSKTVINNNLFRIKVSSRLFDKLREYETFCKYYIKEGYPDIYERTDFGIDDISFNDDSGPLLFTTTHEGYITVAKRLLG